LLFSASVGVRTPYLALADNLDEPKDLGFCLDLKGWDPPNFKNAQAHSCKPGDLGTDQEFEPKDGAVIGRADAAGRCIQATSATAGASVDAPLCSSNEPLQRFTWNANPDGSSTLNLDGSSLCLAASATIRQANNFWARNLALASCTSTAAKYVKWKVVGGTTGGGSTGAGADVDELVQQLRQEVVQLREKVARLEQQNTCAHFAVDQASGACVATPSKASGSVGLMLRGEPQ